MLTKDDFIKHKHQSFYLKLKELASGKNTNPFDFKMVFFGGTGAVGGQAVIEVLESFAYIKAAAPKATEQKPEIVLTGINADQIHQFCTKLYQVFGKQKFFKIEQEEDELFLLFEDL